MVVKGEEEWTSVTKVSGLRLARGSADFSVHMPKVLTMLTFENMPFDFNSHRKLQDL
jgi:hypothetical protein